MSDSTDTPTPPSGGDPAGDTPRPESPRPEPIVGADSPAASGPSTSSTSGPDSTSAGTSAGGSPPNAGSRSNAPVLVQRPPRLPSLRVTAVLAVGLLAIGVAIGAAIGPAPSASFAGNPVPLLLPSIAALAESDAGAHTHPNTSAVKPPPTTPQPTPTTSSSAGSASEPVTKPAKSKTPASAVSSPTKTPNAAKTPTTTGSETTKQTLPPVTHVWLITLTGGTFAQALAQPADAPYIDSQLVPAGALLGEWSSLAGSSFANEAGLLSGEPPQTLDSIVQPPCPEGAAGETCKPETAGALTAADEFLKATVPPITASLAYREHGLIVITFGTVAGATASSLPAGSATATLSSEPPVGVLLISPFAHAGTRPSTKYEPTSPKQSLSELLH
jgi:hypothetical protein